MIHGVCCGAAGIKAAADAGLGYIEPALNQMRSLDDEKLDAIRREAEAAGVPAAGFNCFFGGEIMLYKTDRDEILGYAEHNFKVAQRLGGSYCVIGSGRSRAVPDDMDRAAAEDAFCSIVSAMGKIAAKYGLELVIEPLQTAETNFINTLSDGLRISRRIGAENVGCLVDFYHFYQNGEDLSEFDSLEPGKLRHVHIARPNADRGYLREEDSKTLSAWAEKLKKTGYDGRISLECTWGGDFAAEVKTAARMLELFER